MIKTKKAIIVDIDGTLVFVGDRSYFDASNAHKVDRPNFPVVELVQTYIDLGYFVFFITGRTTGKDNGGAISTMKQLASLFPDVNLAKHCSLYMRQDGDFRKDTLFKGEVFEKHINGKYDIAFALEDRDQMVEFYRNELKIPCFQVNPDTGKKKKIDLSKVNKADL